MSSNNIPYLASAGMFFKCRVNIICLILKQNFMSDACVLYIKILIDLENCDEKNYVSLTTLKRNTGTTV